MLQNSRIASVAIAVGVNSDGRPEMLEMDIGPSDAAAAAARAVGTKRLCVVTSDLPRGSGCENQPAEEPPTTDEMINMRTPIEKSPDADLLPETIGFADRRLMDLELKG
jgi:hypothetical protein